MCPSLLLCFTVYVKRESTGLYTISLSHPCVSRRLYRSLEKGHSQNSREPPHTAAPKLRGIGRPRELWIEDEHRRLEGSVLLVVMDREPVSMLWF